MTTQCTHCNGTGKRKLSAAHAKTLRLISLAPGPIGRSELELAGIAPTAIHNHLKFLERHGLIKRAGRKSQGILWRAVDTTPR